MFVPSTTLPHKYNSLLVALLVALIVHLALLLGIKMSPIELDQINKPIDITLVNAFENNVPEKADFLAQENHLGAGKEVKKPEPEPSAPVMPTVEKSKSNIDKKIISQQEVKKSNVLSTEVSKSQTAPKLTAESLQKQLMQLGSEIRQSQPSAEQTKIKFINSVSTHKYVAAQYMKDWENKVERTGNLNYPEAASKKNFSGTLTMDVGINADGSVYSIRINKSSGNPELDEAAKKIVRMSAPFPPLPLDLRKEVDVLVITRVWKFSDESGLVTQ